MLYHKVDAETGEFIEDVILESHPIDDAEFQFVSDDVPHGIYKKVWKNGKWVEGFTVEEIEAKKNSEPKPTMKSFKSMTRSEKDALLEKVVNQMGLIEDGKVVLP